MVQDYVAVLDQPKLPVVSDYSWEAFMDGIYVNGQFYTGHSLGYVVHPLVFRVGCSPCSSAIEVTAQPNENQTTIILDTGTSYGTFSANSLIGNNS